MQVVALLLGVLQVYVPYLGALHTTAAAERMLG